MDHDLSLSLDNSFWNTHSSFTPLFCDWFAAECAGSMHCDVLECSCQLVTTPCVGALFCVAAARPEKMVGVLPQPVTELSESEPEGIREAKTAKKASFRSCVISSCLAYSMF